MDFQAHHPNQRLEITAEKIGENQTEKVSSQRCTEDTKQMREKYIQATAKQMTSFSLDNRHLKLQLCLSDNTFNYLWFSQHSLLNDKVKKRKKNNTKTTQK